MDQGASRAEAGGVEEPPAGASPNQDSASEATPESAANAGASDAGAPEPQRGWRKQPPTVLTWQDLAALPGQILPEETIYHLKRAGREAMLAVYSLWRDIERSRRDATGEKVRKHIDVE